jgi:glucose-6-phosphate-specific signal transduction histidine kinase
LTDTVEHARAGVVDVTVEDGARDLCGEITDDGRGGADLGDGSGRVGIEGRVGAVKGRIALENPPRCRHRPAARATPRRRSIGLGPLTTRGRSD